MTKRMLLVSMVFVVLAMSLFVGVGTACAAPMGGTGFSGQLSTANLWIFYRGSEDASGASVDLQFETTWQIDDVNCWFETSFTDPTQGHGMFQISGFEDTVQNHQSGHGSSTFDFGGVHLYQSMSFWFDDYSERNAASVLCGIGPFNLDYATVGMTEYQIPAYPGQPETRTWFSLNLNFYGTFPDPAMGLPFVPTPGALGLVSLVGLAVLRRTGRR